MDGAAAIATTARCACDGARCNGIPDRRACDRAGAIAPIVGIGVVAAAMARARWCDASLFLDTPALRARATTDGRRTTVPCVPNAAVPGASAGAGAGATGAMTRGAVPAAVFVGVTAWASFVSLGRATRAMVGTLAYFYVPSVDDNDDSGGGGRGASSTSTSVASSKQKKKASAARVMATTTVARVDLVHETMMNRPMFEDLDIVAFVGFVLCANAAARWCASRWLNADKDSMTPTLALFSVVIAMRALIRTYADRSTPGVERQLAFLIGFLAWIASTFIVFFAPSSAVVFNYSLVADDINAALSTAADGLITLRVKALHVGLTFAVFGGAVAGLILSAAARMVKSYTLFTQLPEWAMEYAGSAGCPHWRKFIVRTSFALPLLTLVVSAPSMVSEPLGLSAEAARDAQSAFFALSAFALFTSVQPLTQAFLDSGLITWYEIKEGSADKDRLSERERLVIGHRLDLTNHLVCKVALQCAAPALLLLACSIAMWTYGDMDASASFIPPSVIAESCACIAWFTCLYGCLAGGVAMVVIQPEAFFAR